MENKSRALASNTLFLTIRMLFLMAINLYTSRVILNVLGVEDYGIYNVVGGIVSMFSIISGSITAAITRYITFELGCGNKESLAKVFSTAVIIQIILSLFVLLFIETIGLWFLNTKLVIPEGRMWAANWVFQLSTLTFILKLLSVPYNAMIIAHEKMTVFAYIGIYEGVAKLVIAYLTMASPIDSLVFYALALCLLSFSERIIYISYCRKYFHEYVLRWSLNYTMIKEMFGFAGWNFIGAAAGILRDQGGNILINLFCGPTANAARGIAYQVNTAVNSFLSSFTTAMHPQITKSYASNDVQYFRSLLYRGAKISFFILLIISLPIIFNVDTIVNLWLGQNPEFTSSFIVLVLILTMSESISTPLITATLATGKIKLYQIVVGGLNMMNLPVSYILLSKGFPPGTIFVVAIIISQICFFARAIILNKLIDLDILCFFKDVYCRIVIVSLLSFIFPYLVTKFIPLEFQNLIVISIVSLLFTSVFVWKFGFDNVERDFFKDIVMKILKRSGLYRDCNL